MSYEKIVDKIVSINGTIDGIKQSLDFEPTGQVVLDTPCLYTKFGSMNVDSEPSVESSQYDVKLVLLIRYTDAEEAEKLVKHLIDTVKSRYRDAVKLDGVLDNGSARITGAEGKYVLIADVIYRVIEFVLRVHEKESTTYNE